MLVGKKRIVLRVMAALLTITSLLIIPEASTMPASAATSLSALQEQQAQAKKKQEETAAKLNELKQDQAKQQEYKNQLDAQMDNLEGQIDNLNTQVELLGQQITEKEEEIQDKQDAIDYDFNLLRQRLHALYLAGEASNLEIILSSKSVADFMNKTEVMQAITEKDQELIEGLRNDMAEIQDEKEQIEADRETAAEAKKELDAKSLELSALVEESNRVLEELNAQVIEANSENNEAAREKAAADAAVDEWYRDYYASLPKDDTSNSASGGYTSTGNFTWPCPGYTKLTSYWGDGRNHKGIDIAGAGIYGKPIVAADSGKVMLAVHSGWGGGYGLCVYLDHGNGYSTRYGHMSKVSVNTGDVVQKGQVIGYVGSTGDSSGPHLHFEIRVNGVAKNPMNWFS